MPEKVGILSRGKVSMVSFCRWIKGVASVTGKFILIVGISGQLCSLLRTFINLYVSRYDY